MKDWSYCQPYRNLTFTDELPLRDTVLVQFLKPNKERVVTTVTGRHARGLSSPGNNISERLISELGHFIWKGCRNKCLYLATDV